MATSVKPSSLNNAPIWSVHLHALSAKVDKFVADVLLYLNPAVGLPVGLCQLLANRSEDVVSAPAMSGIAWVRSGCGSSHWKWPPGSDDLHQNVRYDLVASAGLTDQGQHVLQERLHGGVVHIAYEEPETSGGICFLDMSKASMLTVDGSWEARSQAQILDRTCQCDEWFQPMEDVPCAGCNVSNAKMGI